jgi:sugar phosphate isomerase/epimerase
MIGVHLHDIAGMDDHLTAGRGDMDWDLVARHLPAKPWRTCEFQNASSPQQIADGLRWLVEKGLVSQI